MRPLLLATMARKADDPCVAERAERDTTDLAAAIAGADAGRQTSLPPPPDGWAGLVERDRRARRHSHGNAAGGFELLLYPVRLYVLVAAAVLIPILIVISIVT